MSIALVQCLAEFGVIRQRGLSPSYLKEKDLVFLMDLRLWLGEEAVGRRRKCVALATTPWTGAEGKVRPMGAEGQHPGFLAVSLETNHCPSLASEKQIIVPGHPRLSPSPASAPAPVPGHSLMGKRTQGFQSRRLAFRSQNINCHPGDFEQIIAFDRIFVSMSGIEENPPFLTRFVGLTTETIYENMPHSVL